MTGVTTRDERRNLWARIQAETFRWSIETRTDGQWRRVRHYRSLSLTEEPQSAVTRYRRVHPEASDLTLRAVRIVPKPASPHRGSRA